ncbi:MAG: hypothetical protein EP332_05010 [Bacteroidetes bacterium]|nr:MAG: hypothetical protein EP332_05010 [Bacteroidota bacterium]
MKKILLLCIGFGFLTTTQASEDSKLPVYTLEKDVKNAGLYYYQKCAKELDAQLIDAKIKIYSDAEMKKQVSATDYKKQTLMPYTYQFIDPTTPLDPYNLVDSVVYLNKALEQALYWKWNEKSIEVKINTLDGLKVYYLAEKSASSEINNKDGLNLLKLYSQWYGEVTIAVLSDKSVDFMQKMGSRFYTPGKNCYADTDKKISVDANALWDTSTYYAGTPNEVDVVHHPATAQSINGWVFLYESETDSKEGEVEFELNMVAPTFEISKFNKYHTWYWEESADTRKRFNDLEWSALTAIQSYSIYKKVYNYFDHSSM